MTRSATGRVDRRFVAVVSAIGVAACAGVVVLLTVLVLQEHGPFALDEQVWHALFRDHHEMVELMERTVAILGSKKWGLLIVVIAGGAWWVLRRDLRPGLLLATAFTLTGATVALLKSIIGRATPARLIIDPAATEGRSFPSMHAALFVSLAGMAMVIVALSWRPERRHPVLVAVAVALGGALALAISVMSITWHWLTDVVGGAAVAGVWIFGLLPLANEMWVNPLLVHGLRSDTPRRFRERERSASDGALSRLPAPEPTHEGAIDAITIVEAADASTEDA